ncbi:TPA: hypothetical protein ACQVJY_002023, partial [Serratia marcescens]
FFYNVFFLPNLFLIQTGMVRLLIILRADLAQLNDDRRNDLINPCRFQRCVYPRAALQSFTR